MQIESYRTQMEEFEQSLNRELFRYYSGQKNKLALQPIYSEHSDLFSAESIREVESELSNTGEFFSSRRKSLRKILGYLIDQHLDSHAAPLIQEAARLFAKQTLLWEGKEIALFQVPACLKIEPDAVKRRKLSEQQARSLEEIEPQRENLTRLRSAAIGLGFKNYREARERISGTDYKQLLNSFDGALSKLKDRYLERLHFSFETTLRLSIQEAGSWDVAHWEKKNDQSHIFLKQRLVPVVEATISELGIQPERSDAIALDLESRALKQARPFCIPVKVPCEIKIVMQPEDGSGSYAALLHESGHAHHFAWTNPSLPAEHRIWGDRALAESYAFLLEHLILEPHWLARLLDFAPSNEFLHFQSLFRVFLVHQCAGKLCFAMQLHEQESCGGMPELFAETMETYTGLQHHAESWLEEILDGFDSADYLRGWVLASMLREHLRSKYGKGWFLNRLAAGFLKEIWETGQTYNAEELWREIGLGAPEPQILVDELSEGLK